MSETMKIMMQKMSKSVTVFTAAVVLFCAPMPAFGEVAHGSNQEVDFGQSSLFSLNTAQDMIIAKNNDAPKSPKPRVITTSTTPERPVSIRIDCPDEVARGGQITCTCIGKYKNGTERVIKPAWTISDRADCASIVDGILEGKKAGKVRIRADYYAGTIFTAPGKTPDLSRIRRTAEKWVTVYELSSLEINGVDSVAVNDNTTFFCTAIYSNGTSKEVTPNRWKVSSGDSCASITGGGVLIGKAAGIATIEASYTDSGVTKTVTKNIKVNAPQTDRDVPKPIKSGVRGSMPLSNGANFSIPLSSSVDLDMIWIEPGTFIMGSPENELARYKGEVQHKVTLTQGYWLGKYEVTQAQYQAVMGSNPSYFKGADLPVELINWNDAMDFCAKLTEIEKAAGRLPEGYEYTLPTEAQWEYACRAGTTTALNSGKNLSDKEQCLEMNEAGWYLYNSGRTTHPVGQKQPNGWGFYDMHGNVWEWCLDNLRNYSTSPVTDPIGPSTKDYRMIGGGAWDIVAKDCRSAARIRCFPEGKFANLGFRLALVPVQ